MTGRKWPVNDAAKEHSRKLRTKGKGAFAATTGSDRHLEGQVVADQDAHADPAHVEAVQEAVDLCRGGCWGLRSVLRSRISSRMSLHMLAAESVADFR